MDWQTILIVMVAGVGTGIINTLAGSGSLITLPIFMFLFGLPAPVANGTNRIGVLIQSLLGTFLFYRSGKLQLKGLAWIVLPALAGGIVGASLAVDLNERVMNIFIAGLMIFMLIVLLVKPKRFLKKTEKKDATSKSRIITAVVFFVVGFYGGFIQAGVGLFLIAALVLAGGFGLVESNAVKLLIVCVYSIPALGIFVMNDQVVWHIGLMMAAGQSVGTWIGSRFAIKYPNADVWIHRLLIVIIIISSLKLLSEF